MARTTFLCSCLLFLVISAFVILKTVRDALFLTHYSAQTLPYFMALNTVVSAAVAAGYLRLQRHASLQRIVQASFIAFSALTILFWLETAHSHDELPAILYLWVGILGTMAPVQAWSVISKQFKTREAKNVVGFLGGSAMTGAMAGGLIARLTVHTLGVSFLIVVAGCIYFLAFAACRMLPTSRADEEPSDNLSQETPSIRRSFIVLLVTVVAISTIISTFIDFQFKTLAQSEFKSARQMAAFFGSFYAVLGLAGLLLQVFGVPVLLNRFRLSVGLSIYPLCLLIFNSFFLITGLFAVAVLLRGTEEVLRHSVDRSSLEVLYVAMPEHAKVRIKGLIDTIAVRAPECLASLLLLVLFTWQNLPLLNLTILNVGFLLIWLASSFFLGHREYPVMLKEEIGRKEIDFDAVKENLFTQGLYRLLPDTLRNAEKETVLGLLDLFETSGKRWLGRYLLVALERDEEEIRWKTLLLLFDQDADLSQQVRKLLNDKDSKIRREALHYLCVRFRDTNDLLEKFGNDSDLAMRVAAMACLPRKGMLQEAGYGRMEELFQDSLRELRPDARVEIAHVLQYVKPSDAAVQVYKRLLSDASQEVRKAALKSIAHSRPPELIPLLLKLSRVPSLREELRKTISAYGKKFIPNLARIIEDSSQALAQKKLALKIATDIGGLRSLNLILQAARHKDLAVRFEAIRSLNRLKKYHSLDGNRRALRVLLDQEMENLNKELQRAHAFIPHAHTITNHIVGQRILWSFERVFRLLGLHYDSEAIYGAYHAWASEDPDRLDTALELVEQTVSLDVRRKLLPLLEEYRNTRQSQEDSPSRKNAFLAYLRQPDALLTAAAIHDLSADELGVWMPELLEVLPSDPHPLVKETLTRRQKQMENQSTGTQKNDPLTTIQKMETLRAIDIFSKLGAQELLLLANQAIEIEFAAGQILFKESDPGNEFYCLVTGEVELKKSSEQIALVKAGECIGLHELLRDQPRVFSAKAKRSCICLKITKDSFWDILQDYTSVCRGVIEVLVQQIDALSERLTTKTTVHP